MDQKQENKKKLRKLETRAFALVLETIAIFGVPALAAALIGKQVFESNSGTYMLLALAFIVSWVMLLRRLKTLSRELEEARKKVHTEKMDNM